MLNDISVTLKDGSHTNSYLTGSLLATYIKLGPWAIKMIIINICFFIY